MADDDELWAPFLAFRPEDRHAARIRRHVEQDMKRGARHVPRRAAALSRDEIVRTAIKVADAEGPDAISMRRIARELNAGTMSLYWHVASKEELLDLMIDAAQGEQLAPEPSGDWRADLRALTRGARAVLHRHPWMVDFIGGRPPVGPKALQEHRAGPRLAGRPGPRQGHRRCGPSSLGYGLRIAVFVFYVYPKPPMLFQQIELARIQSPSVRERSRRIEQRYKRGVRPAASGRRRPAGRALSRRRQPGARPRASRTGRRRSI